MNPELKWLLAFSAAAHAAVMFAWVAPLPDAGLQGQVILLDIADNAGQSASRTVTETVSEQYSPEATTAATIPVRKIASSPRPVKTRQPPEAVMGTQRSVRSEPAIAPLSESARRPALAASNPLPGTDEYRMHLRNSVLELITQRLTYPAIARRHGWQGVVTLELHIESSGLISGLQINETSGYPALDSAAINILQLASIPGARGWLNGRTMDMLVPVEYRLLDS